MEPVFRLKKFIFRFQLLFIAVLSCFACQRQVTFNLPISSAISQNTLPVTINQATTEVVGTCNFTAPADPALDQDLEYRVTFSEAVDPLTFTTVDISNSGSGGGTSLTWTIENCGDDTNFKLTASNIFGDGTIVPRISAGNVQNAAGQANLLSTSTDNSVTFRKGWYQEAYIKAVNSDAYDQFGTSVTIQGDTLVVGAIDEASDQTTITNGPTASGVNAVHSGIFRSPSGATYIYRRTGSNWIQEAYVKASNTYVDIYGDSEFGSISALDQDTLAVSAPSDSSAQTTITNGTGSGTDLNPAITKLGSVFIYRRSGSTWTQEAYIKAANANHLDQLGRSISLSGDTLAVGSHGEDSSETVITNGATASADNSASFAGAVYIYKRTGVNWAQEAYIKSANHNAGDYFHQVSLQGDTLAVGADHEDSNETTITNGPGASADNTKTDSGAVYIYTRTGTTWTQEAYLKASNSDGYDLYGFRVSLNNDRLAVSAKDERSSATTITNGTGSSADNSYILAGGAVYVYKRTGTNWAQEAYIKPSNNSATNAAFGYSVSLAGDTLAVGMTYDRSNQTTITNGTTSSADTSSAISGAVFVYKRTGVTWAQEAYIKAANNDANDEFGFTVSVSGDTIAVGVPFEDSAQASITHGTGASADDTKADSGAVYVYRNRSRLFDISDLKATATSSSITLSWTKTGGTSTKYFVTYQAGATAPADCTLGTVVDAGDVDTFTETPLSAATTYSFRVCATDGTLLSEGATVTITTLP